MFLQEGGVTQVRTIRCRTDNETHTGEDKLRRYKKLWGNKNRK